MKSVPNHDFFIFIIIMAGMVCLLTLHIVLINKAVAKALSKYVRPKFKALGFEQISFRRVGFNEKDDFRISQGSFFYSTNGSAVMSIYVFVYYRLSGEEKRITVKIETFFYMVTGVVYSNREIAFNILK